MGLLPTKHSTQLPWKHPREDPPEVQRELYAAANGRMSGLLNSGISQNGADGERNRARHEAGHGSVGKVGHKAGWGGRS